MKNSGKTLRPQPQNARNHDKRLVRTSLPDSKREISKRKVSIDILEKLVKTIDKNIAQQQNHHIKMFKVTGSKYKLQTRS